MPHKIPFIGRKEELEKIRAWIAETGSRHVCFIDGPGGIGKTRLLEEIRLQMSKMRVQMSDVIDFDDRTLFIADNLERRITQQLGEDTFAEYLRALQDLRQIEQSGVSLTTLHNLQIQVQAAFIRDFNEMTAQQRVVLLFDTTDHIFQRDVWKQMVQLLPQLNNLVVLFAGRNGEELYTAIQDHLKQNVHLLRLQSLQEEKADTHYLAQKQEQTQVNIEPSLAQKVLALAEGRPILIDLAVEWLARQSADDWLQQTPLVEIKAHQQKFEAQLVQKVAEVRTTMEQLILLLSHVYPLDDGMVQQFLDLDESQLQKLLAQADTAVFVKVLPDGRYTLHDEMRRMVNANKEIWKKHRSRRPYYSGKAIVYLQQLIETQEQELEYLLAHTPDAATFIEREELEQELWILKTRYLRHILFLDLAQGADLFVQLFDEATEAYRLALRDNLLAEIADYEDQLVSPQQSRVRNRRARYFSDQGQYNRARGLVQEILKHPLSPEQRIDNLRLLANLEVRRGAIDQGVAAFHEAVDLSQDLPELHASSLIGLGWAYRNKGNFTEALNYYTDAYMLSLDLNEERAIAQVLNNMAYIRAYKGEREAALENCRSALSLWQKLDVEKEIGITYSTTGEVYRRFSQWSEAMEYYNRALAIFENVNDQEWISTVRTGRSAIHIQQQAFDLARRDLTYAAAYGPENLKPRILHTEGQLHLIQGEIAQAERLFRLCVQVSQEVGDQEFLLRSFADLLDIAWQKEAFAEWPDVKAQILELFTGKEGEETFRLRGSSYRKLGDMALCAGAYEEALAAYKEGLPLIAEYEIHEPYAIGRQVNVTDARIRKYVDAATLRRLGQDLFTFWKEKGLARQSQEPLIVFHGWRQEGAGDE